MSVTVREEVRPPWAFRLPSRLGRDGLARRRGDAIQRLLHIGDEPVFVGVAQSSPHRVLFAARAACEEAAWAGIQRARFWVGVDEDLREFHEAFRDDPLIGRVMRLRPWMRAYRRPDPWEALCFAVTEQLIEYRRASEIQRRLIVRAGRSCWGMRDAPSAAAVAALSPALLCSMDLAEKRALALRKCAREVASGRVDLFADHEAGWERLLSIPHIGPWTVEVLATQGQGRDDQLPAGDLGYLELVGRVRSGGDRDDYATIEEVREFFEPYGEWKNLAATYLQAAWAGGLIRHVPAARSARGRGASSSRFAGRVATAGTP